MRVLKTTIITADLNSHEWMCLIASVCTFIALCLSTYQIFKHLRHFNQPQFQLYICRIVLMIPIYSVQSLLSLLFPDAAVVFGTLRDCYEAYVLYIFTQLLIQYLGGEPNIVLHLELQKRLRHPWPMGDLLKPINLNRTFFRRIKQGTLQFVLIKPVTAVIALILEAYNLYGEGELAFDKGYPYLSFINNISVSISLYCLILFYTATEERLQPFRPVAKFLCVKAIIFFSFWQSCALAVLVQIGFFADDETGGFSAESRATIMQNFIICVEMVMASIAHSFAFSYNDFIDKENLKKRGPIITNLKTILNVRDVLQDAHETFIRPANVEIPLQDRQKAPEEEKDTLLRAE